MNSRIRKIHSAPRPRLGIRPPSIAGTFFCLALLWAVVLHLTVLAQDAQKPAGPPQDLPPAGMRAWEKYEKQVQKNREFYDKANEKVLASLAKELETMKPPVEADGIIRKFQQEAIVKLDAQAPPPPPPAPLKDIVVFNGHRYKLFQERLSWEEAKKLCEDMGGHLAVIDDRIEQQFLAKAISTFVANNPTWPEGTGYWLGIFKNKDKKWVTVTNQPVVYSAWHVNEPNERCDYGFLRGNAAWQTCDGKQGRKVIICEWER